MAESKSLADEAVAALAAVRAMAEGMDLNDPERHIARNLKRVAEAVLANAFFTAQSLAILATDLTSLVNNMQSEENKRTDATSQGNDPG